MGKDHIELWVTRMHAGNCGDFLRSGGDGQSLHKQGVGDALLIVRRNSGHDPRFEAPTGMARASPPLLAWRVEGTVKMRNLSTT